jgi:hypothetical protein
LYGDNTDALWFDSNDSSVARFNLRDAEDTVIGSVYGDDSGNFGILDADNNWAIQSDTDSNINFRVNNSEKMRITSSGNVGIGEVAPASLLEVGAISLNSSTMPTSESDFNFLIDTGGAKNTTGNYEAALGFGDSGNTNAGILAVDDGASAAIALGLFTGSTGSLGERVRITSTGNVGIGTTNPDQLLELSDSSGGVPLLRFADKAGSVTPNWDIGISSAANSDFSVTQDGTINMLVEYSTGNVGIGTTTPSTKLDVAGSVTATEYLYSSDRDLKTDIQVIDDALSVVTKLEGVSFDWKANGQSSVGFVAQDVEQVAPELVAVNNGRYGVRYGNITAYAVEAIKAQQKKIAELEDKHAAQQDQINRHNKEIQALKEQMSRITQ